MADKSNRQKPKNSMPILSATNIEYSIAVITPAHSKILLFIKNYLLEHFLEQYFTFSQFNLHFLRHTKGLLQVGQIFVGKCSFFKLNFPKIIFPNF